VFFETIATAEKQSKARQGKAEQKQNQYTVSSSNVGSYTEDGVGAWLDETMILPPGFNAK